MKFIKKIKIGISNLIYWLPIIWYDRNWDYCYIFDILKHKLNAQADFIEKRNNHFSAEKDVRNMRICSKLCNLVSEGYYEIDWMSYQNTKYKFEPIVGGNYVIKDDVIYENFEPYFLKYPKVYKKVLEEHNDVNKLSNREIAIRMGEINHLRARKLLFKILESEIESWWD